MIAITPLFRYRCMMSVSSCDEAVIPGKNASLEVEALRIRCGLMTDAPRIALFAREVFLATFGPGTTPPSDPDDLESYVTGAFGVLAQEAELADPACAYLLAESGDTLVGFALIRAGIADAVVTGPEPVEVQRFYVDHRWHGREVAPQLMARCIDMARTRGGRTLWLGVWEFNPRAIRFYSKQGFTDVGSHPFLLGNDLQTDRVMQRSLELAAQTAAGQSP